MITESGSIKVKTRIDGAVHKELNKPVKTLGIVYTVCGFVALAIFAALIVLDIVEGDPVDYYNIVIAICAAIFSTCGVVILVKYLQNLKKFREQDKEDDVEFFSDYLLLNEYVDGRLSSASKIYYRLLVKKRESTHYIFLYNTAVTAICVEKEKLTAAELDTVRRLISVVGQMPGAVAFPTDVNRQVRLNEPDDPFADFAYHGDNTASDNRNTEETKPD